MVPVVMFFVGGLEEETKEEKDEVRDCARCTIIDDDSKSKTKRRTGYPVPCMLCTWYPKK